MHSARSIALLTLLLSALTAFSQAKPAEPYYSRLNTFGIFGEYSNDSSHILLGTAQNRKLLNLGGTYSRRLILNSFVDGQYMIELRPIMLESDPIWHETIVNTSPPPTQTLTNELILPEACYPFSETFTQVYEGVTYTSTITITCGERQWTFGEGFSPVGFKWNFMPRHRIQPVLSMLGGYMFTTKPIPVANAGSSNFTFEFGAGFEFYRTATRSLRVEYLIHHISNANTAQENPGIDSQLVQLTYGFGH